MLTHNELHSFEVMKHENPTDKRIMMHNTEKTHSLLKWYNLIAYSINKIVQHIQIFEITLKLQFW